MLQKNDLIALIIGLSFSLILILFYVFFMRTSTDYRLNMSQRPLNPKYLGLRPPSEVYDDIDPAKSKKYPQINSQSDLDYSKKYSGSIKPPKSFTTTVGIKGSSEVLYSTVVHQDAFGRRRVKIPPKPNREVAILLIGCSHTYGDGVENEETFASILSERFPNINVYNLGQGGVGLNHIYHDMHSEKSDFYFKFSEKKVVIVNTFVGDHLRRQRCDRTCYGRNSWMIPGPYFELTRDGALEHKGTLAEIYPQNAVLSYLANHRLFGFYSSRETRILEDYNFQLWQTLLNHIRKEYQKRFEVLEFYNFFQDSTTELPSHLVPGLLDQGFKVVIGRHFHEVFPEAQGRIPGDYHPTALGHQISAEEIAWALKQDLNNSQGELFRNSK